MLMGTEVKMLNSCFALLVTAALSGAEMVHDLNIVMKEFCPLQQKLCKSYNHRSPLLLEGA